MVWQVNPEDAINSFRQAIGYLSEMGKFKQVGKIHQQIAEVKRRRRRGPLYMR